MLGALRRTPRGPHLVLALLCGALAGCGGGCEGRQVSANAVKQATQQPQGPAGPAQAARATPQTVALEGHLGLLLPTRDSVPLPGEISTRQGPPFGLPDLNRRFWVAYGPKGLRANDRDLLPPGPMDATTLAAKIREAIPDWRERAGVEPKAAILLFDVDAEMAHAEAVREAMAQAATWRLTLVVLDGAGQAVEVDMPRAIRR